MADISAGVSALPPLPPLARTSIRSAINILHPGYRKADNFLFSLPAVDYIVDPSNKIRSWGHHHATALTACGIIANNAFDDVYFSLDQYGQNPIKTPRDSILVPGDYWLQLNSITGRKPKAPATGSTSSLPIPVPRASEYKYPIVPSFADWSFPHGRLPKEWEQPHAPPTQQDAGLPIADQVANRCFLTDINIGLEKCHLIPQAQLEWFMRNGMYRYAQPSLVHKIQDPANILLLLSNLHWAFDRLLFVIIPKPSTVFSSLASPSTSTAPSISTAPSASTASLTSDNKPQPYAFVTHVISATPEARDLTDLYHNRSIQSKYFNTLKREFLFARFAWALFPYLRDFVQNASLRELIIADGDNYVSKSVTGKEFAQLRENRGESINGSRKRRGGLSNQDGEPTDEDYIYEDDAYEERWKRRSASRERRLCDYDYEDVTRGRSRHRDISSDSDADEDLPSLLCSFTTSGSNESNA
ncbi:hypothetical protein F5B18DRAFT_643060 [Nemania serpens]|nr:hypothetical protein F5B18DRAFT_643060 [Nemania serpens]